MLEEKVGDPQKYLVYQGSIYAPAGTYEPRFWLMSEEEWEDRSKKEGTGCAVVLARGLTKKVANKMVNLSRSSDGEI